MCAILLIGCSHSAGGPSGIKGDLVYSGGPASSSASPVLEPGSVIAYAEDGTQKAGTTFAQGQGFSLSLPPGTYKLVATSGSAYCPSQNVTVASGGFQSVRITCSVK